MRTIIAGSRNVDSYDTVKEAVSKAAIHAGISITTIVSGNARGVDQLGEKYAIDNGIPLVLYPADWDRHGKSAGYKRNVQMAENADALIAIWDGESKGTGHMISIAKEHGLTVYVHMVL